MLNATEKLIQILNLTTLGKGEFQGESQDLGLPQVFGGQVLAQALFAAMQLVPLERYLHSCHAYFLQAGSAKLPIHYSAEVLREGGSFSVVSVNAKQENEILLRLTASFQIDEKGFEFQPEIAINELPSQFVSENDLKAKMSKFVPEMLRPLFENESAFDVRVKYPNNPFKGEKLPSEQQLWVKTQYDVTKDRRLQQCLIAYFSDFHCISTILQPHQCGVFEQKVRFATLEHHLSFHRAFDLNQWLLFKLENLSASGARGSVFGKVFDQQGHLAVTYQQEALIRPLE